MKPEPKAFYTKVGLPLLKNKRLLVLGAVVFCAVILVLFKNQHVPKTEIKTTPAEENTLYTKDEIDSFIKEQLLKKESDEINTGPVQTNPPENRKFKTAIAVFIKKEDDEKTVTVISPVNEDLGIPTGSKIKAHLANAIFSFNVTSPVVAVVDEDFIKDEKIIIPKGTQFIGDAGILKSHDRINVRFSVMVLPGGKEIKVNAMALSLDGSGGIKGKVDKQGGKSILKSIGETILAAGAVVLGTKDRAVTLEDELRLNAARNLSDDARDGLNQVKIEESISTQAYTPIFVLFLDSL